MPGNDSRNRIIRPGMFFAAGPVAPLLIQKAVIQVIHHKGIAFFHPGPEEPFMGLPLGAKDRAQGHPPRVRTAPRNTARNQKD